jgi:predicted secreted Zn-dependent protease
MQAESGGDVRALSPKGAMGLMQIMPQRGPRCGSGTAWARIPMILAITSRRGRPTCGSCTIASASVAS